MIPPPLLPPSLEVVELGNGRVDVVERDVLVDGSVTDVVDELDDVVTDVVNELDGNGNVVELLPPAGGNTGGVGIMTGPGMGVVGPLGKICSPGVPPGPLFTGKALASIQRKGTLAPGCAMQEAGFLPVQQYTPPKHG